MVPAGRQPARRYLLHGLPELAAQYASTWRRIWDHIDEIVSHLIHVKWVKGHATMEHVREGTATQVRCWYGYRFYVGAEGTEQFEC